MQNDERFEGYILDTTYADRFYKELSPVWLNYVLTINGIVPFDLKRPFHYLEIGCGFAHSSIVNAASYPHANFYACDIIPAQIQQARQFAGELSLENIEFFEESIESLLEQNFLPELDFIVLHGVYSWVHPKTREAIREAIGRRLKPGGVVYVSYNCEPGNVYEAPLRKFLIELAKTKRGNAGERSAAALIQIKEMSQGLDYFKSNPAVTAALDARLKETGDSLAHEFMNETWKSFYSVDLQEEMQEVDLSFAGSATLVDNHPPLAQSAKATQSIQSLPNLRLQRLAEDFASNRGFRRDVFVKGRPRADANSAANNLGNIVLGCGKNLKKITTKVRIPRGLLTFDEGFIVDLGELMAKGSFSISEIIHHLGKTNSNHTEILRNLLFLTAAGVLTPFVHVSSSGVSGSQRLPMMFLKDVLNQIVSTNSPRALPSVVAGNGFVVSPEDARELLAMLNINAEDQISSNKFSEIYLPWLRRLGFDVGT